MARHRKYHDEKALPSNDRLCYVYGIWKSAKRSIRWISGVRKTELEKEAARISGAQKTKNKPEGSISGVGKELVKLL